MAVETLGPRDPFRKKFLLQFCWSLLRDSFCLILILELGIDAIHHPEIELMAILMQIALEGS